MNLRRVTSLRLLTVTREVLLAAADARSQSQRPTGRFRPRSGQRPSDDVWLPGTVAEERDPCCVVLVSDRVAAAGDRSRPGLSGHLGAERPRHQRTSLHRHQLGHAQCLAGPESVYNIQVALLSVTSWRSVPAPFHHSAAAFAVMSPRRLDSFTLFNTMQYF